MIVHVVYMSVIIVLMLLLRVAVRNSINSMSVFADYNDAVDYALNVGRRAVNRATAICRAFVTVESTDLEHHFWADMLEDSRNLEPDEFETVFEEKYLKYQDEVAKEIERKEDDRAEAEHYERMGEDV